MIFTDEAGCVQVLIVRIDVEEPDHLTVPNIFSPNFDGENDEFIIFTSGFVENVVSFRIYDRWGNEVYLLENTNDSTQVRWNGRKDGNDVAEGVYVYTTELELASGERISFAGDLSLVR